MKKSIFLLFALISLVGCQTKNNKSSSSSGTVNSSEVSSNVSTNQSSSTTNVSSSSSSSIEKSNQEIIKENLPANPLSDASYRNEDDIAYLLNQDINYFKNFVNINLTTRVTSKSGNGLMEVVDDGKNFIIRSDKKMKLILTGTLTNGSVIIEKEDGRLGLELNNASITSFDGPAINIQSSKRTYVMLPKNTTNTLIDSQEYSNLDTKATLFSEGELLFSGEGTLNIRGKNRHGICSDDYIRIIGGKINVLEAVGDGIHANDYVVIDGGETSLIALKDGIEVERGFIVINNGKLTIDVVEIGLYASGEGVFIDDLDEVYVDPFVVIYNGDISINADLLLISNNHNVYSAVNVE